MRVLFVGRASGQPLLMRKAMERRGHEVTHVDPYAVFKGVRLLATWSWHTGALGTSMLAYQHLRREIGDARFDIAFVDNGEIISPAAVRWMKLLCGHVVLFNRDNPFVARDGTRWRTLLSSLFEYDLYVTPRRSTADRALAEGVTNVLRVNFFADETLHFPHPPTDEQKRRFGSPVSFVGTWFPERGQFMDTLIKAGVPLKIIGNHWQRAANYATLAPHVIPGYLSSSDYSAAVRSADIAIAMLSKGNEDVQTSRSSEIPAMGVLLCAERTSEHLDMYDEGVEAVFWSSAEECAEHCLRLLAEPRRIQEIAMAGRERVLRNDNWTETAMERILATAIGHSGAS